MSNVDPIVSNVTVPDDGAVHLNQTEPVERSCAVGIFSAFSNVAPELLPALLPDEPEMLMAFAKSSFVGRELSVQCAYNVLVAEDDTVDVAVICVPPEDDVHQPANVCPAHVAVGSAGEAYVPPMVYVSLEIGQDPPLALNVTV